MSERNFRVVTVLAILVAGGMAYVNTFDGEWVWDDVSSVLLHQDVQNPANFVQLFTKDQHAYVGGQGNFYRPLVSVTFMIDSLLSERHGPDPMDLDPLFFHMGNFAWHALAALALFALLSRLEAPRFVRAVVPVLFVLHPLHTEAVAYISGRADIMAGAFLFAGLMFALAPWEEKRPTLSWVISGLCFVAALLSKESAAIYPVLLALLVIAKPLGDVGDKKQAYLRRSIPLAAALAVLGIYAGLRMTVLNFAEPGAAVHAAFGQRLFETAQAFAFYLRMLFVPVGLHMEQSLDGTPTWTAIPGALGILACVAGAVLAWRAKKHRMALGLAWFLIAWFPISGIIPLNAPMAEHWMYVPMAGFWLAVIELLALLPKQPQVTALRAAAVYGLALFFLVITVDRNQDWHDNETLYRATLAHNPNTKRIHHNLAVTYEDLLGNRPGAIRHFEKVIALGEDAEDTLLTDEIGAHLSLGELYYESHNYQRSAYHFGQLTRLGEDARFKGEYLQGLLGLGQCFIAQGAMQQAFEVLNAAAQAEPALGPQVQAMLAGG